MLIDITNFSDELLEALLEAKAGNHNTEALSPEEKTTLQNILEDMFLPVQTRKGVFNAHTGTRVAMTGENRTRVNPHGFVPHPKTGHPTRVMGFHTAVKRGLLGLTFKSQEPGAQTQRVTFPLAGDNWLGNPVSE